MEVLIVGGGVAGPATAIALQAVGLRPTLLEARTQVDVDTGSWFTIAPNGIAALRELGVLDAVRDLGVPTRHNVMVGSRGRPLGRLALGRPIEDGTPALSFKRTALAARLLDVASSRGAAVQMGCRATSARTVGRQVEVVLDDGRHLGADVVLGADGIHSAVRRAIDPDTPAGRFVGLVNFGGITTGSPWTARLPEASWTFVFGRRAFFGALPTPDGDVVWFANLPREPVGRAERADTSTADWQRRLVEAAAVDRSPFAELIAAGTLELAADNTYDLPTVPVWHAGRVGLVGDALHAPSPSSGQGASLALEDAVVMAAALRTAASPEEAFADFERSRRERVEKVVAVGARSSSSKTAGPVVRPFLETALRLVFRHVVTERSQAWMFDHRVALRPS